MNVSGDFGRLLEPGLRRIYGLGYKEYPQEYPHIFNVENSKRSFEESYQMAGLPQVPVKPESVGISYEDAISGATHKLYHVTYGLGFKVSKELAEDDQYKKINRMPKMLSKSVRVTIETVAANILNRAFNSSYVGADGVELCSAVHPLLGGGTYQNEPSTAADLDMTSLEQALIDVQAYTDDRGHLAQTKARKLIIAPSNEWQAQRLLKSAMDPETANNAINPAKGIIPEGYTVNHYLTDPDAWFIKTDATDGLVFYWRRRPMFAKDNDFDGENAKFKTTYRMIVGWDDSRGIYGNPGA